MLEVPKRLAPTYDTLRQLYLHSGNCCAFPGCDRLMMDKKGDFIGHVCHIEAALFGGERFNANMTNEQRRHGNNLVLLCYDHHVTTNDESIYDAPALRQIKADHEALFADPISKISRAFADTTQIGLNTGPTKLEKMNSVLEWALSGDELTETARYFRDLANSLAPVPKPAREVFSALANRGVIRGDRFDQHISCPYEDLRDALRTSDWKLREQIRILEHHSIAKLDDLGDGVYNVITEGYDWSLWEDLRAFCAKTGIPIAQLLVDGDFKCLD